LSVFARDTTIVVSGTTLWQQLLRHGVTLLPAISFAINKSSFVSLYNEYIASMEEAKRLSIKEEEKKEEKKKKGSDNNTIMRRRRASSFADSSFRENMYVKRTVQLVSPFIILVGMVLGIYITGRVYTQRSQCLDLVGPIATCMKPTLYFENGFFGKLIVVFPMLPPLIVMQNLYGVKINFSKVSQIFLIQQFTLK
jgi:hypothetical protein